MASQGALPRSILKSNSAYALDDILFPILPNFFTEIDPTLYPPRKSSHQRSVHFSTLPDSVYPALSKFEYDRRVLLDDDAEDSDAEDDDDEYFFTPTSTSESSDYFASKLLDIDVDAVIGSTLDEEDSDSDAPDTTIYFTDSDEEDQDVFGDGFPPPRPNTPLPGSQHGEDDDDDEFFAPQYLRSAFSEDDFVSSSDESDFSLKTPVTEDDEESGRVGTYFGSILTETNEECKEEDGSFEISTVLAKDFAKDKVVSEEPVNGESPSPPRPFVRTPKFRGGSVNLSPPRPRSQQTLGAPGGGTPSIDCDPTSTSPISTSRSSKYPSLLSLCGDFPRPPSADIGPRPRLFATRHKVATILQADDEKQEEARQEREKQQQMADALKKIKYSRVRTGKQPVWSSVSADEAGLGRF